MPVRAPDRPEALMVQGRERHETAERFIGRRREGLGALLRSS